MEHTIAATFTLTMLLGTLTLLAAVSYAEISSCATDSRIDWAAHLGKVSLIVVPTRAHPSITITTYAEMHAYRMSKPIPEAVKPRFTGLRAAPGITAPGVAHYAPCDLVPTRVGA